MSVGEERIAGSAEGLRELAVGEQRRAGVPSLVLGAARAGKTLDVRAVGVASVEHGLAAAPDVAYRIGSVTKTFTAALALTLVEDGVVGLEDRVGDYLPGTPLDSVTIRALLSHSGGVQREAAVDMWESMHGPDSAELRRSLGRAELVDRPGARWHYSNLGYAVLGQIIEEVCGRPCASLIDERLIDPLGLATTTWTRPVHAAAGYRVDPYSDAVHLEPNMDQAAVGVGGQLWSTALDLLTWGHALTGGRPEIVAVSVVDAMHTLQVMVDRTSWTSGWGLGLMLNRRGDRVTSGHTGATPGFAAALELDRTTAAVAVVLSNATRGADVRPIATKLIDMTIATAPGTELSTWTPDSAAPAELDGVLGRWWSEADETVFRWREGQLRAQLVSGPVADETRFERLAPDSYRAVAGRFSGERLHVRRDADRVVQALVWATYPFTRTPR